MAISDLFDREFRKRNKDHFASIVRVAMSDGTITENEQNFLDRLAPRLNISDEDYKYLNDATDAYADRIPAFYCSPKEHKQKISIPQQPIVATKVSVLYGVGK